MDKKFEFFKKYCEYKGLLNRYAFGVVSENGNHIKFLSGDESSILMYGGKYIADGVLYEISEATCGGKCKIGEPHKSCMDKGYVSKDKCAVHSYDKVDLENFKYELSYEDFVHIKSLI